MVLQYCLSKSCAEEALPNLRHASNPQVKKISPNRPIYKSWNLLVLYIDMHSSSPLNSPLNYFFDVSTSLLFSRLFFILFFLLRLFMIIILTFSSISSPSLYVLFLHQLLFPILPLPFLRPFFSLFYPFPS